MKSTGNALQLQCPVQDIASMIDAIRAGPFIDLPSNYHLHVSRKESNDP